MSESQFSELFDAVKGKKSIDKKVRGKSKNDSLTPPPVEKKSIASATAKSKNSEFEQALIYLKKTTKKEVKKTLLDDPSGRNFSDLVEELLSDWLENQK